MKKSILLLAALLPASAPLFMNASPVGNDNTYEVSNANPYELAERFTRPKLATMLFSTSVDPHWFPAGDKFWYTYKTGEGTRW